MARSFETDPLMACNFALIEVPAASVPPLAFPFKTIRSAISAGNFVGFQSMIVPELTLETREIRQGNWPYVHKVILGYQNASELILSQAVLPLATDMYLWFHQALVGIGAPRRNMLLVHTGIDRSLPLRVLSCEHCIPIGWKPASDFDASDSSVSLESLTLSVQRVNVLPTTINTPA